MTRHISRLDDLAILLDLACTVEDRTDVEQRALLRVAGNVDDDHNAMTVTNPLMERDRLTVPAARFYEAVIATRVGGKPVHDTKAGREAREKRRAKADLWDRVFTGEITMADVVREGL